MRPIALAVLSLAVLAGPLVGQGEGRPDGPQRRMQLEQEVRRQFTEQVARRLELTETQRGALVGVLREGAESRQALAEESRALRRELMRAVRDEATPMATYEGLLERLDGIRDSERAIEEREKARLEEVLDARQRAAFLIMRMQFNERVRGMRGRPSTMGPGSGDPPRRGGPGGPGGPVSGRGAGGPG